MFRRSNDLRRRVIDFIKQGNSKSAAVRLYKIARQSVYDWLKLDEVGVLEVVRPPKPIEPNPKHLLVLDYVKEHPDAYNYEIAKVFGMGTETVRQVLIRNGISVKKNRQPTERLMKVKN
jgi:transposase